MTLPAGPARGANGAFQGFTRTFDTLDCLEEVSGLGAAALSPTPLGARWAWGGAGRLYSMTTKDKVERIEGAARVYNFEVRDLHSYFVGTVGAVVHNCGPSIGDLRRSGQKDAHYIIQDASVRDLPGYDESTTSTLFERRRI